jgi:hypothetical protein
MLLLKLAAGGPHLKVAFFSRFHEHRLHLTRLAEIIPLRVNGGLDFVADRDGSLPTLAPCSRTRTGRDGGALFENQQIAPVIEIHIEH